VSRGGDRRKQVGREVEGKKSQTISLVCHQQKTYSHVITGLQRLRFLTEKTRDI